MLKDARRNPVPGVRSIGSEPDERAIALMRQVGTRVRDARDRKGISRRALSETSGVSPRYLAQLEAGEGNISIGLLMRVAIALGQSIESLVAAEDALGGDGARMAELFRAADAATRARVMRILDPAPSREQRANRTCLIGLRGAGKSTLGSMLGAELDIQFIELNREIEELAGMPVAEIMALYGQEGYRQLEANALDRIIATRDRIVLAVAGGIVAEPATFSKLLERFHSVWVKASPAEHMERVRAQGDTRPMAGNPEAMEQLRSILTGREALYQQAEVQLDTSGRTVEESLRELIAMVAEAGFLA